MDGFGRKTILVFCQLLAGVACIAAGYVNADWAVTTLTLAGERGNINKYPPLSFLGGFRHVEIKFIFFMSIFITIMHGYPFQQSIQDARLL